MKSIDMLVRMANQIAANLQHEPNPAAATATHIRLYWDPRMKAQIKAHGEEGLDPTALAAIALIG
jgi:formate dehydrogenase subunit delta